MKGRIVPVLALVLLTAACGSRQQFVASAPVLPTQAPAPVTVELPPVKPAVPAYEVELRRWAGPGLVRSLAKIDGVSVATPLSIVPRDVTYGGRHFRLRVAAVDPLEFRSIAPVLSREADFVWTALVGNRAVLTPATARKLGFDTAGSIRIGHGAVDVGAFADNGVPNLADVLVPQRKKAERSHDRVVMIGVRRVADIDRIGRALKRELGHRARKLKRLQPRTTQPTEEPDPIGTASGDLIGSMNFQILKNGFIKPDPAWVAANIASGTVPILGSVTCNRLLFPQLYAALAQIEREGLARAINPKDYGGCYVPRFIDRDPRRGLSAHAFGLALDINVSQNYLGTRGHMDPRVVAIFESWGFEWGGRWARPDPMHFQLARIIDV